MTKKHMMRAIVGALVGMFGLLVVPALAAASGPQFGTSFQATPVSGTVTVTVGGHKAKLTHERLVPDGSTFDATQGVVRLTAANGTGGAYSGLFTKGGFQAQQSKTNPATAITLTGPCTSTQLASDKARAAVHHRRIYRNLQATAPPDFVVIGQSGQAHAITGTAKYTLSDACKSGSSASTAATGAAGATKVRGQSGQVQASSKDGLIKQTVHPGAIDELECSAAKGYCVTVELETRGLIRSFFFPAVATSKSTSSFQMCLTTPAKKQTCLPVLSNEPSFSNAIPFSGGVAVLGCQASQKGTYSVSWRLHGVALGAPLPFPVSSPTHAGPCSGSLGNLDSNPQRVELPSNVENVSRFRVPFGITLGTYMYVDLAPSGIPGSEKIRGVVYASNQNGAPGKLVEATKPRTFTSAMQADPNFQLTFPSHRHLVAGKYWIGVLSGGGDRVVTVGVDPLTGSGAENDKTVQYSHGPTNPFGPFVSDNDYLAVVSDYIP